MWPEYGRLKVKADRAVWQNRAKIWILPKILVHTFARPHCFPFDVTLSNFILNHFIFSAQIRSLQAIGGPIFRSVFHFKRLGRAHSLSHGTSRYPRPNRSRSLKKPRENPQGFNQAFHENGWR